MGKAVYTILSPSELNPDPLKSQKLFQIHDTEYVSIQDNQNEITFSFVLKYSVLVPVATNANWFTVPCRTLKYRYKLILYNRTRLTSNLKIFKLKKRHRTYI